MKSEEYWRGKPGVKYGIWNSVRKIQRYWGNGRPSYKDYYCPVCSKQQKRRKGAEWYCERCGQKLVWGADNDT